MPGSAVADQADRLLKGDLSVLDEFSSEEREVIQRVLGGARSGDNQPYIDVWQAEWKRRPVDLDKFLDDPYYLGRITNKGKGVFPVWRDELHHVLNPDNGIYEWIIEGGIGIGKSYVATLAMLYKWYLLTCMRSPQSTFGIGEDTTIFASFFNTTLKLAEEVTYKYFQRMTVRIPYFQEVCHKPLHQQKKGWDLVTDIVFPNNMGKMLGSNKGHSLGQAVYVGILDEANFGTDAKSMDPEARGKVYELYDSVRARYVSRFKGNPAAEGLLCVLSSVQTDTSFLEKHKENVKHEKGVHVSNYALWEAKPGPWDTSPKFYVMTGDRAGSASVHEEEPKAEDVRGRLLEVPMDFWDDFNRDIEIALRDLAGVATFGSYPLIAFRERVIDCVDEDRKNPYPSDSVVVSLHDLDVDGQSGPLIEQIDKNLILEPYDEIRDLWRPRHHPSQSRYVHVDLALNGDACGFAMGCAYGSKKVKRFDSTNMHYETQEHKIFMDLIVRIKNAKGSEIDFDQVIRFIQWLNRSGFKIRVVTYDGWQSAHSMQILKKGGFNTAKVSVDRTPDPYMMLKSALYDRRLDMYYHEPFINEVTQVQYDVKRQKVDHLPAGCFVGETRVSLLDGTRPMISELVDKDVWVFSSKKDGTIVPGRARGRKTKDVTELVDVVLDTGAVVRCTPEHPWMLRNGEYKRAKDLVPHVDRLMPIVWQWPVNVPGAQSDGYEAVSGISQKRLLVHRLVHEFFNGPVASGEVIHHRNELKSDNRPENLEAVKKRAHSADHSSKRHRDDPAYSRRATDAMQKFNLSEEGRQTHSEAMKRTNASRSREDYQEAARRRPRFRSDIDFQALHRARLEGIPTANGVGAFLGCGRNVIIRVLREHGYASWSEFCNPQSDVGVVYAKNHRVRAVVPVTLGEPIPVYDLEVDRWDNFALASGVIVHNSKDVSDGVAGVVFGIMTDKSLRRIIETPVATGGQSAATKTPTKNMLIRSEKSPTDKFDDLFTED